MALLDDADVERRLAGGPWRREGETIVRELRFEDFLGAMAFANRVAQVAEAANHHPDILVHSYNRMRLTLSTHSAGGLTEADLALADAIEALI